MSTCLRALVPGVSVVLLCELFGGAPPLRGQEPLPSPGAPAARELPDSFLQAEQACNAALAAEWRRVLAGRDPVDQYPLPGERAQAYRELFDSVDRPAACRAAEAVLAMTVQENSNDLARSFEAAASNPSSRSLTERAGLVQQVAMALRSSNFVSADGTAVTLNLSAAAAFCPGGQPCGWDRLGGAVTFGAQVPQKELVGFSGFPDPEKLLDVLIWDAKLRLIGDRNPDGAKWRQPRNDIFFRGAAAGWDTLKLTNTFIGAVQASRKQPLSNEQLAQELGLLQRDVLMVYLKDPDVQLTKEYDNLQGRIARSWLVTVKLSGQHLTNEVGKNKYAGSLLVDKGIGTAGFTFNATYSAVQDVRTEGSAPFTLKTWQLAAGLSGDFMANALVRSRSTEWSLAGRLSLPRDGQDVPIDRKRIYEATLELRFPVSATAHIPITVTYTNDSNNLSKQRYVRGQVGINYDFGALKKVVSGGS